MCQGMQNYSPDFSSFPSCCLHGPVENCDSWKWGKKWALLLSRQVRWSSAITVRSENWSSQWICDKFGPHIYCNCSPSPKVLPGVSGWQKPPRFSHLQISNCSYFCKSPNYHCAKSSEVGQADLKTTRLEEHHSFFDPKIEAVQSEQQGITFVAVAFGLDFFFFKFLFCDMGTVSKVVPGCIPRAPRLLGQVVAPRSGCPCLETGAGSCAAPAPGGVQGSAEGGTDRGSTQPCCTST